MKRLPFFYGWVVGAVAVVIMGFGVYTRPAFFFPFPLILDGFDWEREMPVAAFFLACIAATLYTPFLDVLMDSLDLRLIISLAVIVMSMGIALATWASYPWHLYLTPGGVVVGLVGSKSLEFHWVWTQ